VCEKDLEQLLGEVWACAWQQLYKNNAHLVATSIAKLVLESAGHPLTLCIDESTTSSKYLLDDERPDCIHRVDTKCAVRYTTAVIKPDKDRTDYCH
jgi:hypothetical protein